ncbi:nuclear transport factor 2 family protein [Frankia sp. AgB1.9]|uniref:nuclear transport factor 2 family protein n=1 Tax=unclassified Frankia TaxID=2632575 RepID=UPI0019331722|nr:MULTISPECIES: nuclear transport factor 2 family protein [unclassified Frankia]MBL7489412.1 nuclear transport factor 2 family protein [Frankia sp. AgW1.1]MBL7550653.1 nuclear transport factor 2 family protein [Frankia sp. AgB1.9]MBL7620972.1 nuclear transport factor 2 family protein [Frankia sp. AgB1.8]
MELTDGTAPEWPRVVGRSVGDLADRLALRDLAESYAAAVDSRDEGLFVSLFTSDAVVRVYHSDREGEVARFERARELPLLVQALSGRYPATLHLVGNHRAQVVADSAVAETYCLAHHLHRGTDGAPQDLQMLVRYADSCVRGSDGLWRFRERVVTAVWHSSHPARHSALDRQQAGTSEAEDRRAGRGR